jgi:DNA-binding CsgD family transcriptional regulator
MDGTNDPQNDGPSVDVDAASVWDGLVEGRWSVAGHFDHEGHRVLIVRRQAKGVGLTRRERQIFTRARAGHAGKWIAMELGISEAMVSTTLRSVARKLGARSRLELVRLFAAAEGAAQ